MTRAREAEQPHARQVSRCACVFGRAFSLHHKAGAAGIAPAAVNIRNAWRQALTGLASSS